MPTTQIGVITGREHRLRPTWPLPITLADVTTTKPNQADQMVQRQHVTGIWTCDDLSELTPDVPVIKRFPSWSRLLYAAFSVVAER